MASLRNLVLLLSILSLCPAFGASLADRLKDSATGAGDQQEDILRPDEAFVLTTEITGADQVKASWRIADGYYLYQDKFKFEITAGAAHVDNAAVVIPRGKVKEDPSFGSVEVIYHGLAVAIPIVRESAADAPLALLIRYQGCKENSICYPPIKKTIPLILSAVVPAAEAAATSPPTPVAESPREPALSEQDAITQQLISGGLLLNIAAFFGFGLLLSLTPCIFPMIPILSGLIIGTHGEGSTPLKGFALSLSYVLAMALTYAVAGVIAAMINFNIQAASQNVWVISVFSLLFILLALSMFGFYDIQLPSSLQSRLTNMSNSQEGGRLAGAFVMGSLSAIIVGPCVAPPLAGALLYISQTGNQLLGGLALFALGIGMGVPLLIIGASAGSLLPRAGMWMENIKKVFGVILIGVAIWFVGRIVPAIVELYLWAALLVVTAVYLGALDQLERTATWARFWKGMGIVMLVYGIVLVIGASGGSETLIKPLEGISRFQAGTSQPGEQYPEFKTIKGLDELQAELNKASLQGKTVMLDFYADWCVSCIEMETYTFPKLEVRSVLRELVLLKADVTGNDEIDQALMNEFKIFGPPAILFFGTDALEKRAYRLVGFLKADEFVSHIKELISS
jgi:thiol:disulfide interchange protein DsbD